MSSTPASFATHLPCEWERDGNLFAVFYLYTLSVRFPWVRARESYTAGVMTDWFERVKQKPPKLTKVSKV